MISNHKVKKDKQDNVKKKKLKRSQNDRQRNGKKTKDWETGTTLKPAMNPGIPEGKTIPVPLEEPVVVLSNDTNIARHGQRVEHQYT
jgi:hypothetical protein